MPTLQKRADQASDCSPGRPMPSASKGRRWRRRLAWLLAASLPLLLAQAFIPIEQFVHRGDDAYYYFQLAAQFPRLGFWSFDGIHPTNGVQPLWAIVLTGVAVVMSWAGVTDPNLLARIFVACAALSHFGSCLLLYHLLSRAVSTATGLVAAGAFLFPMGIVWSRVWGMENSLYALLLVATLCQIHLVVLRRSSDRSAAALGSLLGLTALARLNAALLLPFALGYVLWELGASGRRTVVVAGVVALFVVAPYFVSNLASTGHALPVSGVVKDVRSRAFLEARGVESRWSFEFVEALGEYRPAAKWFVTSRLVDSLWIAGSRLVLDGDSRLNWRWVLPLGAVLAFGPVAIGRRRWLRYAAAHAGRLRPFGYVLAFAAANVVVSVIRYPSEVGYGMIRWWWVEVEIVLVVASAALVAACGGYVTRRLVRRSWRMPALAALVTVLVGLHGAQMVRFYWSGRVVYHDWKLSWNDELYAAALWLNEHRRPGERVGAWNAAILGYYTRGSVINLDGLANDFELVPYLERGRIADYIRQKDIAYLSDIETEFTSKRLDRELRLSEVYSRYSEFMHRTYRIYRVERDESPGPGADDR